MTEHQGPALSTDMNRRERKRLSEKATSLASDYATLADQIEADDVPGMLIRLLSIDASTKQLNHELHDIMTDSLDGRPR